MEKWVLKNKEAFERDVFQDFCLASDQLFAQFRRAGESMAFSFPVLRALVGEPRNKGMLWRLKDKAHHVFMREAGTDSVSLLLDWTLGYIFHEALKVMEDAHQRQYYAPRLTEMGSANLAPEIAGMVNSLLFIQEGTSESMQRGAARLAALLFYSRRLFTLYFAGRPDHRPLARFLNDNEALVRRTFQDEYEHFIASVYADEPERMHLEAAASLLTSAREESAREAVHRALVINPDCRKALQLKEAHGW